MDVTLNGNLETSFGDFSLSWTNSFILSYIEEVEGGSEAIDTAGWNGQPDYKSVFTTVYKIGNNSLSWNMNYTDSTYEDKESGSLDSWLIHNISYGYDFGNYGSVLLGVNNLTDEDPVLSSSGAYENPDLYNNYGREYRASYTLKF